MIIATSNTAPKLAGPSPQKKSGQDKDGFWKDRADELREMLLFVDQEKLEDAGRIIKGIGSGLKGAWQSIKEVPSKVFNLPLLSDKIDQEKREELVELGETLGRVAGFVAVGGHAVGGALKVASGRQQKDTSRKLDGIMDMATAATLGATVAGMVGARTVLAPLTAAFNIFRGGYNAGHGFKTNDGRKQLQGSLDAVRSAGSVGRLLKTQGAVFNFAGIALAPIAGALQAGRGLHDLSIGLRNDDNKKQLKGLVDVATAVGTAMAFASGVAIIPGIALAVAANLTKVAYELSPKARGKIDPVLDRWEPKLEKVVRQTEKVTEPVREAWKKVVARFVKEKEAQGPAKYSPAKLGEISQLLHCDGNYSRQEERRLKVSLERVGQGRDTPSRKDEALPVDRSALKKELGSQEQRIEFLRYMLVVAHFDNQEKAEESSYIDELSKDLGVKPRELQRLREEYATLIGH